MAMLRRYWTLITAALLCLLLVALPDADIYSRYSGAFVLAAITVLLIIIRLIVSRSDKQTRPQTTETVIIITAGTLLTALFWFRAYAGLRSDWLVELELIIPAIFGWAWPALFLVLLYRRPGEGWRPTSRSRFVGLCAAALFAGFIGYLLHLAAWSHYSTRLPLAQSSTPADFHHLIIRPTETPHGITLLGGPLRLQADPDHLIARHPATLVAEPVPVSISGTLPFFIRRDLSWQIQGTELESSHPQTLTVSTDQQGRWLLQPKMPGPAIVTIRNRWATGYIGVWVANRDGEYRPFSMVTDKFSVKPGPAQKTDGHMLRQTLTLKNTSDSPVLGPIYALFHTENGRVAMAGIRRTRRITPKGIAWVEASKASWPNRAPVIAPGESIHFDIEVIPELTQEWLHYNMDLIQTLTAP